MEIENEAVEVETETEGEINIDNPVEIPVHEAASGEAETETAEESGEMTGTENSHPEEPAARSYTEEDLKAAVDDALAEVRLRQHFDSLMAEGKRLEGEYAGFSIEEAIKDPVFLRLTAPGTGIGPEDAWWAMHRQELLAEMELKSARDAAARIAGAVASGAARPVENGGAGMYSPAAGPVSHSRMTPEERQELRKRIFAAGMAGEHLAIGG